MSGDSKFLDAVAFVEGREGKKKPYKIGFIRIDAGGKMSGRIDGLPVGNGFDGSFIIEERKERDAQGALPKTQAGGARRPTSTRVEDDQDIPF